MKKAVMSIIIITMLGLCACTSPTKKEETWRVGDYKGQFMGIRKEEDNEGGLTLFLKFEFTNYSNEPISFNEALNPSAYQDNTELQRIEDSMDPASINVPPNETHSMDVKFYTQDKLSVLDVVITNKYTRESYKASTNVE